MIVTLCLALAAGAAMPVTPPAPAPGVLLVASPRLADPNFSRTVVLLLAHGADGALGLVLNRPTQVAVSRFLPQLKSSPLRDQVVFIGGPVGRDELRLLLRSEQGPPRAARVLRDVYLASEPDTVQWILQEGSDQTGFRAYLGYAGWAPGQLEAELARGDWSLGEGSADLIFEVAPGGLWQQLDRALGGQWVRRRDAPGGRSGVGEMS